VLDQSRNPDPAGFGVYVHWPFCAAKCPYCDFNSHVRHGGVEQARFLDGYRREIRRLRDLSGPRLAGSIFFGGGTPSLMEPATLAAILQAVHDAWDVSPDAEITLEANPTSVEADRFRDYRRLGINRVSLGVQALNGPDLKALGRLHSVDEALAALEIARRTFDRFSFDLIYARPGQTLASWREELAAALAYGSEHLSLYQLTIEEGTPFAGLHEAGKLIIPEPEAADDLYELTQDMTAAAGLPAYEISNHAVAGQESRHNLLYWRYGEYAGIGPGAHGRLICGGRRTATSSERLPERWLERLQGEGDAFVAFEALDLADQADELLLMGLRIREGVDLRRLAEVGGVRPAAGVIAELQEHGLLHRRTADDRVRVTDRGRFILNRLVLELSSGFEPA
jgi:putative oxygen-independent coproporphyrinogen III oxidase